MNRKLSALLMCSLLSLPGIAQNMIHYSHHLENKNEMGFYVLTDLGYLNDQSPYFANIFEFEYGITDFWTTEIKLETAATSNIPYEYIGYRIENRFRLLSESSFIVPVLYAEFENLSIESPFVQEVTGYAKNRTGNLAYQKERELETRIILGKDFDHNRANIGINWINTSNLEATQFGYSIRITYRLSSIDEKDLKEEIKTRTYAAIEMYGGLGNTVEGMSINPGLTEHYVAINYGIKFRNGLRCSFGGHIGISRVSRDYFKLKIGYSLN